MIQCDYQSSTDRERCDRQATCEGLITPEQREVKVKVCNHHSYRWNDLWGTWPISEESEEWSRPMSGSFYDRRAHGWVMIHEGDYLGTYMGGSQYGADCMRRNVTPRYKVGDKVRYTTVTGEVLLGVVTRGDHWKTLLPNMRVEWRVTSRKWPHYPCGTRMENASSTRWMSKR